MLLSTPFMVFTKLHKFFKDPGAYDHISFCMEDLPQSGQVSYIIQGPAIWTFYPLSQNVFERQQFFIWKSCLHYSAGENILHLHLRVQNALFQSFDLFLLEHPVLKNRRQIRSMIMYAAQPQVWFLSGKIIYVQRKNPWWPQSCYSLKGWEKGLLIMWILVSVHEKP